MEFDYKGLSAATVTPTNQNGSVNNGMIPQYVEYLLKQGVKSVFVNGTTGNWSSFSLQERQSILEAWMKHGENKLDCIMVNISANSLPEAKTLCKHAEEQKVAAVGCLSPTYFKPDSEASLVAYLAEVASVAPNTPFLYYHIPVFTNLKIDIDVFLELAYENIPTFCGLKCSTPVLYDSMAVMRFTKKKLILFCGFDDQLMAGWFFGARAAIGTKKVLHKTLTSTISYYTFAGKEFNELLKLFEDGKYDQSKELQIHLAESFTPLLRKHCIVALAKYLVQCLGGLDMGPPRLPVRKLTSNEKQSIKEHLKKKGFTVDDSA